MQKHTSNRNKLGDYYLHIAVHDWLLSFLEQDRLLGIRWLVFCDTFVLIFWWWYFDFFHRTPDATILADILETAVFKWWKLAAKTSLVGANLRTKTIDVAILGALGLLTPNIDWLNMIGEWSKGRSVFIRRMRNFLFFWLKQHLGLIETKFFDFLFWLISCQKNFVSSWSSHFGISLTIWISFLTYLCVCDEIILRYCLIRLGFHG